MRTAQRHAAVPHVEGAGDESLIRNAFVAARVFIGDVTRADAATLARYGKN